MRTATSFHLLMISLLALALAGCPTTPVGDDDAGDDDETGDDDTGDDDTGDDDDTIADDDTYVPDETDGQVTLTYSESGEGGGGVSRAARLDASFPTLVTPASGDLIPIPPGLDQCAVNVVDDDGLAGYSPAGFTYESAGTLTVSGAFGDKPIGPTDLNGEIFYQLLLDVDDELDFGTTYGVTADGDSFPAFETSVKLEMPEEVTLITPAVGGAFHMQGDYEVRWEGGNTETVWLFAASAEIAVWPWEESAYGFLACEAANDGSFTIPAAPINQMPEGDVSLTLVQTLTHYKDVDGRWVAFSGVCSLTALGSI